MRRIQILEEMCQLILTKSINEKERYVILARVIEEKGFDKIAAELGIGYKGAAAMYYRAIKKLKNMLREDAQRIFTTIGINPI